MTDYDCPPPPHSSLEDISRVEESDIEDVNDDGIPTFNQDHNDVDAQNIDGNSIANQPSLLTRFSTWFEKAQRYIISFLHESQKTVISFFGEAQRDAKIFIKEGSTWGWLDQLDPSEQHPLNRKLPQMPYPKAVLVHNVRRAKPAAAAPMEQQPDVAPPQAVDQPETPAPTMLQSIRSFLAELPKSAADFAEEVTNGFMPLHVPESEFVNGVHRAFLPAPSDEPIEEAADAVLEDATEMVETEAAAAAVIESIVSAVADHDPMIEQKSMDALLDETAAAAALESVVSAVADQESSSDDETRAAEDAAQLLSSVFEGPAEETAMATAATMETLAALAEEDVVETAPTEDTAPVESAAVSARKRLLRELLTAYGESANKLYAKAMEGAKNEEMQTHCGKEDCEQRAQTGACNGQCTTRGNAENGEN